MRAFKCASARVNTLRWPALCAGITLAMSSASMRHMDSSESKPERRRIGPYPSMPPGRRRRKAETRSGMLEDERTGLPASGNGGKDPAVGEAGVEGVAEEEEEEEEEEEDRPTKVTRLDAPGRWWLFVEDCGVNGCSAAGRACWNDSLSSAMAGSSTRRWPDLTAMSIKSSSVSVCTAESESNPSSRKI